MIYQKARAYDELGRAEEAMETMGQLASAYPHSAHYDEIQFRRAEFYFTRRKFRDARKSPLQKRMRWRLKRPTSSIPSQSRALPLPFLFRKPLWKRRV